MKEPSLLGQAAPDFGDPVGLLRACHGRILSQCDTLTRLPPHLETRGLDAEAGEAMSRVQRYFDTAARHHHEDEEQDLFPRLRGREDALDALLEEVLAEHERLSALWNSLRPWLVEPSRAVTALDSFTAIVGEFVDAYRAHAEKENARLLPRAEALLDTTERDQLGARMAARRGVGRR